MSTTSPKLAPLVWTLAVIVTSIEKDTRGPALAVTVWKLLPRRPVDTEDLETARGGAFQAHVLGALAPCPGLGLALGATLKAPAQGATLAGVVAALAHRGTRLLPQLARLPLFALGEDPAIMTSDIVAASNLIVMNITAPVALIPDCLAASCTFVLLAESQAGSLLRWCDNVVRVELFHPTVLVTTTSCHTEAPLARTFVRGAATTNPLGRTAADGLIFGIAI